jgi:hypothetical protein
MSLERFHSAYRHPWGTSLGALCVLLAFPALVIAGEIAARPKSASPANQASGPQAVAAYGRLPLSFEVNHGQTDARVKFLSRGRGYTLLLTGDEAVLTLRRASQESKAENRNAKTENRQSAIASRIPAVLRLRLVGANPLAKVTGLEELPGKSNYFIGNDPKKWRTNASTYAKVAYKNVYPGIDLVYYGNQRQLEYDFVVAPGADPKTIRFAVETGNPKLEKRNSKSEDVQPLSPSPESRTPNPASVKVDANGDLVIATDGGEIRFRRPVVYQIKSAVGSQQSAVALNHQSAIDNRQFLDGRYVLLAEDRIGFEVADYEKSKPLIIDPVLSYSTYLGGSDIDEAAAIAVDGSGNAYLIGDTTSGDFPVYPLTNPLQPTSGGASDVFVTKLNALGTALVYSTYLGGSGDDTAYQYGGGIAVDSAGNAYLTGGTSSTDFPTTVGAVGPFQRSLGGGFDAFVAKLDPTGSALVYSTYLGGSSFDFGGGIAIDSSGNAYVAGQTYSSDFPLSNPLQPSFGGSSDAFVASLDPTGSALNYSTYLGGSADDFAYGMAVDGSGNAYVTGRTHSFDFPTPNAYQAVFGGVADAFVAKLAAGGTSLLYSTYLGGSDMDGAIGIAADSSGDAYVTGWTYSSDFPKVNPLQQNLAGAEDGFVAKLNPAGSALLYSTFLGGSDDDQGYSIAVDSSGNAYVTGYTSSTDFPTASPLQDTNAGAEDAFVAKVNSAGSALIFSTYLGGNGSDYGAGIWVDSSRASGDAYVAGATASTDFPTTTSAYDRTCGTDGNCNAGAAPAASDAFVAKLTGLALPVVSRSPTSLDFGSLGVGFTSAPRTVTLTNNGDAVLNITIVPSGDFALAGSTTCPSSGTVAAGTNCTIDVTFTPTATGSCTGDITITDDAYGSPHVVSLAGDGLPAPAITLSATSLDLGSQLLGTSGSWVSNPANTVTVTNTGTAPLIISPISISSATGDFTIALPNTAGPTACQLLMAPDITLAVSESCRIPVQFLPTVRGFETGQITITHNAPGSPHVVTLSGTGIQPAVSLSPTSVGFTGNPLNMNCPTKTVTLKNTGDVSLTLVSITATPPFSVTDTCPTELGVGESCTTIQVKFSPTVVGPATGTLTVTTDPPVTSGNTVSLSGNGLPACHLLTNMRSATVVRGTDSTSFGISDASPSCSAVPIELSCRLDNPALCALSPATISPSGSSTLQVSNLRAVAAELVTVVVDAVSEFRWTSESLMVLIADFAFTRAPEQATVRAGGATSYALAIRPVNRLAGTVKLSCSGAPRGATCSVSPATVTLDGSSLGQATVRVTTTARALAGPGRQWRPPALGAGRGLPLLLGLISLAGLAMLTARRRRMWLVLSGCLLLVLVWVACGGGGTSMTFNSGGTPAGTYTLTITGSYMTSSGGTALVHDTTVSLTVN